MIGLELVVNMRGSIVIQWQRRKMVVTLPESDVMFAAENNSTVNYGKL